MIIGNMYVFSVNYDIFVKFILIRHTVQIIYYYLRIYDYILLGECQMVSSSDIG